MADKKKNVPAKTKDGKVAKKENGFVRFFKKIGSGCKGIVSELKKVTWPTFGKVMSQTLVVLVFVLIFLVVFGAFDALFNWLLQLLGRSAAN